MFELAASQGQSTSQFNLGLMYARKWSRCGSTWRESSTHSNSIFFEAAAKQSNADAQNNLGTCYGYMLWVHMLHTRSKCRAIYIERAHEWWMKSQSKDTRVPSNHSNNLTKSRILRKNKCASCATKNERANYLSSPEKLKFRVDMYIMTCTWHMYKYECIDQPPLFYIIIMYYCMSTYINMHK